MRPHRRRRHTLTGLAVAAVLVAAAGSCTYTYEPFVLRWDAPVVLTGADLEHLEGLATDAVVAFRFVDGEWQQLAVQVDERKVVDFGERPYPGMPPGTPGTVYGSEPIGLARLQYTDPSTFVGPDDWLVDVDDELVFMAADAGVQAPSDAVEPAGVVPGSGVEVEIVDPVDGGQGWVYLFAGAGELPQDVGDDRVSYDFHLLSGDFMTTYVRGKGPNPEESVVTTDRYEVRFSDRWMENDWRIAGGSGVDVLDGYKLQLEWSYCRRSNVSFSLGAGSIVANVDGPVRAIRSVIGGNSGPYSQRTNIFYADRQEIVTDWRVHPVRGLIEFVDLSVDAIGMSYDRTDLPEPVAIDGVPDQVPTGSPGVDWYQGPQGTLLMASTVDTTIRWATPPVFADTFLRDELNPTETPCSGDPHFIGASGWDTGRGLPNTDPSEIVPAEDLRFTRTVGYALPSLPSALIDAWGTRVLQPLDVVTSQWGPEPPV